MWEPWGRIIKALSKVTLENPITCSSNRSKSPEITVKQAVGFYLIVFIFTAVCLLSFIR